MLEHELLLQVMGLAFLNGEEGDHLLERLAEAYPSFPALRDWTSRDTARVRRFLEAADAIRRARRGEADAPFVLERLDAIGYDDRRVGFLLGLLGEAERHPVPTPLDRAVLARAARASLVPGNVRRFSVFRHEAAVLLCRLLLQAPEEWVVKDLQEIRVRIEEDLRALPAARPLLRPLHRFVTRHLKRAAR